MEISTERIYTIQESGLLPRVGAVEIDMKDTAYNHSDRPGPISIRGGLMSRDQVVFLGYKDIDQDVDAYNPIGYLVTNCLPDGSGVLVSGDLIEENPSAWVNDKILDTWRYLYNDGYSLDEFGLHSLHEYVMQHSFQK